MLTPSPQIIQLMASFAKAMYQPTFSRALTLVYGAILAPGQRTLSAILRVMGLENKKGHECYHRVFSRNVWSPMLMSKLLLLTLVSLFAAEGVIVIVVDETLIRRWGRKISYKSWYRDGVRSTAKRVALSMGIRWSCMSLVVEVPWSHRRWALPFLVTPVLSEKVCRRLHKKFHGTIGCTAECIRKVRQWLPDREIVLSADGDYAAVELVQECQNFEKPVTLVCRMRTDARLFDPAPENTLRSDGSKRRGPQAKKGSRQPNLSERLKDTTAKWQTLRMPWNGGQERVLEVFTGVSLWHRQGLDPAPLRWVLVRSMRDAQTNEEYEDFKPCAYLCSDVNVEVEQILMWVVYRWSTEVTFEEMRRHMGLETQRNWSLRSIGRMTPCLFGLFSLVVAMAKILHPTSLPVQKSSWYKKEEPTFADVLAAVRSHLWACLWKTYQPSQADQPSDLNYTHSPLHPDLCLFPTAAFEHMQTLLCYA